MADYNTITFEQKGRIALVTLNRPDSLNALNAEVMAEMAAEEDDARIRKAIPGKKQSRAARRAHLRPLNPRLKNRFALGLVHAADLCEP